MKKSILSALLITFSFSFSAFTNDFNKGMYELNRGEFHAAIEQFKPLVDDNYAPAQYQMAKILLNGQGTAKNQQQALVLMTKAAEQNYSDAHFALSVIYSDGKIVPKDLIQAFKLMKKAALKELASAQFNLGVMYAQGLGTKKDNYQATRWYQKSANQNYALAQFNLALMYFEGKGVEQSHYWSYVWNSISSKGGYKDAEKSKAMDARNLNADELKAGRTEAQAIYTKLVRKQDKEAKAAAEALTF